MGYDLYIFNKYNFFYLLFNNNLLYIYLDRYLLSIFLFNFSNIWLIDKFFIEILNIIYKVDFKSPNALRYLFKLNYIKNPLIICFMFLFRGWLSLFAYYIYFSSVNKLKFLIKIQLLNLIFDKFLIKNNKDNQFFFLFLRKVNFLQKISLFIKKL
jgi:hypothetical protein